MYSLRALRNQRTLLCMQVRTLSGASNLNRPAPPPLPREDQREFEELLRKAQTPLASNGKNLSEAEAELALHPDARAPLKPEFQGEVNPTTGEQGGPKQEPVGQWKDGEGDWSFKGRVSDF
ncbi:hypothetical protein HGRIS_002686 [Hohenbuehelia grisea]|uniref:Succinate dehydrogenase assembly factor 4, mitochondrial n=1 Tax=Hohenbuehelia grisea TaxID=104357 RepID=A0ABR3JME6_9AGAR